MNRKLIALALLLSLLLGGCWAGPSSSGATGTVAERERKKASAKSWRKYNYTITVREDGGGKLDKGRVSKETYERCQVGDRWPDCKKKG